MEPLKRKKERILSRKIVKRTDWKSFSMPEECEKFKINRKFSKEELSTLRLGHIPEEMEDKWFWYMEGNTLYAHRSWTGYCIFILEIDENAETHNVTVNRDKEQYKCEDINQDIDLLNSLLHYWGKPEYDYYSEWLEEISDVINIKNKELKNKISLYQGNITTLDCDCIVNAANSSLLGGGGVDGAIHRAAGPKLLEECRMLNGCKKGKAKITKGYNLPAKFIIHTVGPVYSRKNDNKKLLSDCYTNSLNLAKENDIHSIAFPAISTGAYGYPLEEATDVAVKTVLKWLGENINYEIKIIFCCFDKKTYDLYDEVVNSYFENFLK